MRDKARITLFSKLNPESYKALEAAAVSCKHRGNPTVELAHWFYQALQRPGNDLDVICRFVGVNTSRLIADLTDALDALPRGATGVTGFSPKLDDAVRDAAVLAEAVGGQVRSGYFLLACLQNPRLRPDVLRMSLEFDAVDARALEQQFDQAVRGSSESPAASAVPATDQVEGATDSADAMVPAVMGRQQALDKFSVDLTAKAREGKFDPIVGREAEIRQLVGVLLRRQKNNPILVGEAGVGKTSVVEGFAQRIVSGDVPPALKNVTIRALDIGLLLAGASMKGEFEQRLRQVIDEAQGAAEPVILFIDEAHTLIGAGGAKGSGDAANLLKPALARGTLRTIAATTHAEYKEFFEKDPALTRRFELVKVDEPADETAAVMVRAVARKFEKHHQVMILDEAIEAAVKLSRRYMPSRQLPDKAVALLDTACARVALALHAAPAAVDEVRARIAALRSELDVVERESSLGLDHLQRRDELGAWLKQATDEVGMLEKRWLDEKGLVESIIDLRGRVDPLRRSAAVASADAAVGPRNSATATLEPPTSTVGDGKTGPGLSDAQVLEQIRSLRQSLGQLQGDLPLVLPDVDAQAVAEVVSEYSGIPVGRMVKDEVRAVLDLPETLSHRVIGQRHALEAIATQLLNSRVPGLDNATKPIGVFLLAGPSGVGKTETALALADAMYGGEQNLIVINMSEYQEAHTVALLKGAPPGYVGYGKGGVLTEAVRKRPYSVVLLDEVEKAHPDVHEIFFQVFDKGFMDDSEGRRVDFKNTIILLTSNVGSDLILDAYRDPAAAPEPAELVEDLRQALRQTFPDALLGRLQIVPYKPITPKMLERIIRLQLDLIVSRVREQQRIPFSYTDDVVAAIASYCREPESGARKVGAVLSQNVVPAISREFLRRVAAGDTIGKVALHVGPDGAFVYEFD